MKPNYAPDGFRYYHVQTPTVFRELLLPDADYSEMSEAEQAKYDYLSELASLHGTAVHSSPYRCG